MVTLFGYEFFLASGRARDQFVSSLYHGRTELAQGFDVKPMESAQSIKRSFSKDISPWGQCGGPEKDREFCVMSAHLWGILS